MNKSCQTPVILQTPDIENILQTMVIPTVLWNKYPIINLKEITEYVQNQNVLDFLCAKK